jgi:hypothetical protein
MTSKQKTWLKILGGLILAYIALSVIASEGTVVDQTTGKPIAGAAIVAFWIGNVGVGHPRSVCYAVESTISDANGHFNVSWYSGSLNPLIGFGTRNVDVIAPGYEATARSDDDKLLFMMAPREGTMSEQFKKADDHYGVGGCPHSTKALPFLKVWQKELARLASTRAERERADDKLWSNDAIEFGTEVADKNRLKRLQARPSEGGK